jgi:hypothetical protein
VLYTLRVLMFSWWYVEFVYCLEYGVILECIDVYVVHIVTYWAVSRKQIGKHIPTNVHPTIEGQPLLGNRLVNTSHNNRVSLHGCTRLTTVQDIHW